MAGWRRAVELAMTAEEVETPDGSYAVEDRGGAPRGAGERRCLSPEPIILPCDKTWRTPTARSSAAFRGTGLWRAGGPRRPDPRPGKEPTITPEAKAWLLSLACDKAEEHGYPHELWTTRLLARHARERGPAAGHESLAHLVQGTVCKILGQEDIKPHKVRYYLERRDAESSRRWHRFCVSTARSRS